MEEDYSQRISSIEQRLKTLEMRLAQAKTWSKDIKKPAQVDGNKTASFNTTSSSTAAFEVRASLGAHVLGTTSGGSHEQFWVVSAFLFGYYI